MTIIDPPSDAELASYVRGTVSAVRASAIDAWAAHHPGNTARVESIRTLLVIDPTAPQWDHERMWAKVLTAVGDENTHDDRAVSPRLAPVSPPMIATRAPRWSFAVRYGAVAAAALVLAGASYGAFSALRAFGPDHEYVTRRGERATVQLNDGTRITLAPESRLRIRSRYGRPQRAVELQGEAAFEVVHDPAHEFSVHAGRAIVVDVGTRFDLRAYPSDSVVRVAVAEGEVILDAYHSTTGLVGEHARPTGLVVARGALGHLDVDDRAHSTTIGDTADYFGWTDGRLVFVRQPLRDVLVTIARWSDVDLRVSDVSLGAELVTAEFPAQAGATAQSGVEMASVLARAVGASVERSGNTFTLVRR